MSRARQAKPSTRAQKIRRVILAAGLIVAAAVAGYSVFVTRPSPQTTMRPLVRGTLIDSLLDTNTMPTVGLPLTQPALANISLPNSSNKFRSHMITGTPPRARMESPISLLKTNGGFLEIGFDKLAFFRVNVIHQVTDPVRLTTVQKLSRPIPDFIKSLDNRDIEVTGFMLPLEMEGGLARRFLLMRSRSFCCFGKPLEINEWISVRMVGEPVFSVMDQPMTVYGTLHVGEMDENGRVVGIYRLDGKKLSGPSAFR